ncbi:hexokinase [Pancytospora philotis]|nr:hexokinase [Pancytospora philotis]
MWTIAALIGRMTIVGGVAELAEGVANPTVAHTEPRLAAPAVENAEERAFCISAEAQRQIYEEYRRRIREVASGVRCDFLRSLVDMGAVRQFRSDEHRHVVPVVDVGGSFLKVSVVEIAKRDGAYRTSVASREIEYKPFNGRALSEYNWDEWVAEVIARDASVQELFKAAHSEGSRMEYAALTFSYALNQTALNRATIKEVHKQWRFRKNADLGQKDIVESFNAQLAKQKLGFEVNCVLNDAVATYMAGVLNNRDDRQIGMIVGTGTNGAFEMALGGKMELMNNEWAQAFVPMDILTPADEAVLAQLHRSNQTYQLLEVLAAGYKFVDITKAHMESIACDSCERKEITLNSILHTLSMSEAELDSFDRALHTAALGFKRRAAKILAAVMLAIAAERQMETVHVTMNGSICAHLLDYTLFTGELVKLAEAYGQKIQFVCVQDNNASLTGAAFTALATGAIN